MGGIWRRLLTCSEWAKDQVIFLSPREQQAPTFDDQPPSSLRIYGAQPAMHRHLQPSRIPLTPLLKKSWFSVSLSRSRFLSSLASIQLLVFSLSYLCISIISSTRIHLFSSVSLLYSISLYFFYLPHIEHSVLPIALSTYLPPLPYFPPPPSSRSLTPPTTLPTQSPTPSFSSHPHSVLRSTLATAAPLCWV